MSREPMWRRYLRLTGADPDADVADEMRFHLDMRVADYMRRGLPEADARARAEQRFGSAADYADQTRTVDRASARDKGFRDRFDAAHAELRYAGRRLLKTPVVTVTVALSLALGIGANLTVYWLVDALVLRPLPGIRAPGTLVEVSRPIISYPAFRDFRDSPPPAFTDLAAISHRQFAVGNGERAERMTGAVVSGNYFALVGASARVGRLFLSSDEPEGAPPVAVISHALWQRSFGGSPDVVGKSIPVNGVPVTVVGVAPQGFRGTRLYGMPSIWIPAGLWLRVAPLEFSTLSLERRTWGWLTMLGRLAPGSTPEAARASLGVVLARDSARTGSTRPIGDILVRPAQSATLGTDARGGVMGFLAVLVAAVVTVLLISCLNVSNVMVARLVSRERELAISEAVGASGARLRLQVLAEVALIALTASVMVALTFGIGGSLLSQLSLDNLHAGEVVTTADAGSVLAAVGLTFFCAAFVALVVMRRPLGSALAGVLRSGAGAGGGRGRVRDVLIVVQVALCTVLLVAASLFVRGTRRALDTDLGFDGASVAYASLDVGVARLDFPTAMSFYDMAVRSARAIPGVGSVALVGAAPLSGDDNIQGFAVDGYEFGPDEPQAMRFNPIGPGFAATLRIPMRAGREFAESDGAGAPLVIVVTESFAARYLAGGSAVGRQVTVGGFPTTVVGVMADVRYDAPDRPPVPMIYAPAAQLSGSFQLGNATLLVRTTGDPAMVLPALNRELRGIRADVPVSAIGVLQDVFDAALAPQRIGSALFSVFGLLALATAAIGLYGILSYMLSLRKREFGVRSALGAQPAHLYAVVLRQSVVRVLPGLGIGLVISQGFGGAMSGFLWGVAPSDPIALITVTSVLLLAALAATVVPASRAARAEPMRALRID